MSHRPSNIDMLNGPIAIKITLMAIPIMLTAILQQLFSSADMIVAGRFAGSDALAAVGANMPVINLMVSIFTGLSIGSNVVVARLIGQGAKADANKAARTSILLSVLSGLVLSAIGLCLAEKILNALDTPAEVIKDAVLYFRIYFIGMPFYLLYNFCAALLRAKGDTRRPLYVLAVFGILNVLLNLFFVVNCSMGVAGVATATLITSSCSAMVLLCMLSKEADELHIDIKKLSIDAASLREIARIGLPTGLQSAVFSLSNVIIQDGINSLGPDAMAATTTSLTFDFMSYFTLMGFAQAGMSFLSQNIGARQMRRCRRIVWQTLILGIGCVMAVSWTCLILRYGLSGIFTTSESVIRLSAMRTLIVLPFYFIHSINELISALLRAAGYSLTPALICTIGICATRVIWISTVFQSHHTFSVLCYCYPISWAITSFVMVPAAYFILKRILWSPIGCK